MIPPNEDSFRTTGSIRHKAGHGDGGPNPSEWYAQNLRSLPLQAAQLACRFAWVSWNGVLMTLVDPGKSASLRSRLTLRYLEDHCPTTTWTEFGWACRLRPTERLMVMHWNCASVCQEVTGKVLTHIQINYVAQNSYGKEGKNFLKN